MRRLIPFVAVMGLVFGAMPSVLASQPQPIPTTCATHWVHTPGWDVSGKQADEYWYDDEGVLHHHGTGWLRANGDPYCQGFWWLDGNWWMLEAPDPTQPAIEAEFWGTIRMELSTPGIEGGFETSYVGSGVPGELRWEAELSGDGYGALEGWKIWMFIDNGDLETGYVTPPKK